jgi:Secretion system C-terminal sorting domain
MFFKCFSFSLLVFLFSLSAAYSVTWFSVSSGNMETDSMWSLTGIPPGIDASNLGGFNAGVDLVIQNGDTADLYNSGSIVVGSVQVDAGGRLWSTRSSNRYITIYGNILCNGVIGNGAIYNTISFNIESVNCTVSGFGQFDASRIRKNYNSNTVTNLMIAMDVNLRFDLFSGTALYNNSNSKQFNITVNPGYALNIIGNTTAGNVALDGTSGSSIFDNNGTILILGTMNISGSLYMSTNNTAAGDSCNWIIGTGGVLKVFRIVCPASGLSQSNLTVEAGGTLELTGPTPFVSFSLVNNNFNMRDSSTVYYSLAGNQPVTSDLEYGHIVFSGSGIKTPGGKLLVKNNLSIVNTAVLSGGIDTIKVGGNWYNWGAGGYDEAASVVMLNGPSSQNINNPAIEKFNKLIIDKPGNHVYLNCTTEIGVKLDLTLGNIFSTDVTPLIIDTGSTVSNVSNNSYVDGPVIKKGLSDFVFPLGKDGMYRPLELYNLSAYTEMKVEYIHQDPQSVPYNVFILEPSLHHVSRCEYWSATSLAGTPNSLVRLSWDNPGSCGVTDLNTLRVTRWDGTIWNDEGNGGTSGTTLSGLVSSLSAVSFDSTLMPITLASNTEAENPLPIQLGDFTAHRVNNNVLLKWITHSEINNHYFNIERSSNGSNFYSLDTVIGAGNSVQINKYEFTDINPLNGINYYRLKQTDFNGDYSYSPIKYIYMNSNEAEFMVYPTLSTGILNVHFFNQNNIDKIRIIDLSGRIVLSHSSVGLPGSTNFQLDISSLTQGIYFLYIQTLSEMKKIIKI